ncbi:MAG: hypothetical protein QM658_07905 [Gordonia sp. (in: high G+C Gram-positive bacteria)]
MDVPPGGHTEINDDGSATVYDRDGNTVRQVARPWAFDSAGRPQKTWYEVDDDGDLVQHVEPAENALYPILADPTEVAGAGSFREADEKSMEAYDTEFGATVPEGAGDFRQAEERSMDQADALAAQPPAPAQPEQPPEPEPEPPSYWVDGNGSQRTYTVNEYGQKVWTTTQSDGTVITVTEGGGSDGADKPWTRTEITPSDGDTTTDYATDGVTGYVYNDEYGTEHRYVQYRDGDLGEQRLSGGDEGAHKPETTTVRWAEDGSVFMTRQGYDGHRLQYDRIGDADGDHSVWILDSNGPESFKQVEKGPDGVTSHGYDINKNGLRNDWRTTPDGWTRGSFADRGGHELGTYTVSPDGTIVYTASPETVKYSGHDYQITTITPDGKATTVENIGGQKQERPTMYGELPWQEHDYPEPDLVTFGDIGRAIAHPFVVVFDEIHNGVYGQPSQIMRNPMVPYKPPPERDHSAGEIALAAVELVTMVFPLPKGLGALGRFGRFGKAGESGGAAVERGGPISMERGGATTLERSPELPAGSPLATTLTDALRPPKMDHVFVPKHKLEPLVGERGSEEGAMRAIVGSLDGATDLPAAGPFEVERVISGQNVVIRGAVVNGVPRIGTVFVR